MSNVYARFMRLLPGRPLLVGTVTAYADGVATLEMLGGGVVLARGEATIGNKYFFREGAIEGPAPDLPEDIVEV
jgi:hypothetical protein